jgi:oligoribonuclease (3'-5' exoribonuclease)
MYRPSSASPIRKQRRNTATGRRLRSHVPSTMPPMAGTSIATDAPSADIG